GFERQANFRERRDQLIHAAADAPLVKREVARLDLARFYLARDMAFEAKAVLDVSIADHPPTPGGASVLLLRAIASILMGRPDAALKDLGNPIVGGQPDSTLWRAM